MYAAVLNYYHIFRKFVSLLAVLYWVSSSSHIRAGNDSKSMNMLPAILVASFLSPPLPLFLPPLSVFYSFAFSCNWTFALDSQNSYSLVADLLRGTTEKITETVEEHAKA
ncbi:hypothetical protein KQX54_003303 [Cotesia glomerata]|uniref:Uncharacterized protein n=1 Tax=Cotesia glomerata TaxID=32391 RepID=A0AAV7HWM2_COTGL|nr:hypothetical protein KQX54_003303 [Cotesia glomerata]